MTTLKQTARVLAAADCDTRHAWPVLHDEAMHYAREFGRARGMLEAILDALNVEDLPENVREKYLAFQKARIAKALREWGE